MPVSLASASVNKQREVVLIMGLNWLGDSIMCFPAIQLYRHLNPQKKLVALVRPHLAALWALQPAVDEVWAFAPDFSSLVMAARRIASFDFQGAFVLPHSWRASLPPFLARVPRRVGLPGHGRDWMLTQVVQLTDKELTAHQSHEYQALFGMAAYPLPLPHLTLPAATTKSAEEILESVPHPRVALMPGAARGPAKRWPGQNFIQLGRMLKAKLRCGMVMLGSEAEQELCEQVAQGIGVSAFNLAGRTNLPELAAILSSCNLVVANDSGGMHLAAAVGAPVVAIFGITDPGKTGPLGKSVCVLQDGRIKNRDIARRSAMAEQALQRITPEQVLEAALGLLNGNLSQAAARIEAVHSHDGRN